MLVGYALTRVVKYIKEDLDGFIRFFPETTPSIDVSRPRNLEGPKSLVQIGHIDYYCHMKNFLEILEYLLMDEAHR